MRFATAGVEADVAGDVLSLLAVAVSRLGARARRELEDALSAQSPLEAFARARRVLERTQPHLARALTDAQLAAALGGMRRVGHDLPELPLPPAPTPAALPPGRVSLMAAAMKSLPPDLRQLYADSLLPAIATAVAGDVPPPPTITSAPAPELPEPEIEFPLIAAAVADLRQRRLLDRAAFDQLLAEAKRQALAVAGAQTQDALGKIQEALADVVATGADLRGFRRRVEESLGTGTFLSPAHEEVVFRNNIQQAYSSGMDRLLANPIVSAVLPYEETLPIRDSRLTTLCSIVARSGIQGTGIFRADDPTWHRLKPPRHHGCRCGRRPMTVQMAAERGIREAIEWLRTGTPPTAPAWVPMPPVQLPPGWGE